MNYPQDNFAQTPQRPIQETQYYKEREQTVYHKTDNDVFGTLMDNDYSAVNFEADQRFKSSVSGVKQNKKSQQFEGQLPYRTTPRSWENRPTPTQMVPEVTQVSKVCFNEALDNSGPWYLRHWPLWENAPFLPSIGDVSKDPRYAIQTKGFTTEYKQML